MGFIIEDKKLVKYESEPGIIFVVIPEGITEIGEDAFRDCSEIKIVVIPDTVTIIGESAFRNCSGLIKLKLPDSITEIGGCAFEKCSGLTEVVLPPLLKELRHDLFDECANLKKVVIPDGVEKLWGGVFHNCYNLKEVNIPESVTVIGGATFYRCNNLEEIFIPDDVTEIYQGAFTCCINLSKIHLPKKLKSIENEMFYCCEKLREVVIPDGVDSIDEKAFFRSGLERIVIPDSVKYIGWDAFCECKALRSISLPDNDDLKIVAGAFNICPSVEEIQFPKNGKPLKGILGLICDNPWYEKMIIKGNGFIIVNNILYRSDAELINAEVPEGVTYISEYAFTGSKQLVSINIPDSVETVDDAFDTYDFNKNLETITFGKSGITLSANVFMHHPNQVIPVREMLYNKAYDTEFDNEYVTTKYRALIDYLSRNEEHDDTLCEYIKENIDKIIHEFINAKEADYISVIADLDGYISQEKINDYVKDAEQYNNVYKSPYTAEVYQTLCDIQKKMLGITEDTDISSDVQPEENKTEQPENSVVDDDKTEPSDNDPVNPKSETEETVNYEVIQFGNYNEEPIEWRVLEKQDDKMLIIAEHVIADKKYYSVLDEITWDKSDLRKWLNDEFLNEAFTKEEQQRIILSILKNDPNPVCGTSGGDATQDKIFCISEEDVKKYFKNDKDRICTPTEPVIKSGFLVKEKNACHWWLRSPGRTNLMAASVFPNGMVFGFGMAVNWGSIGVRPAMWISI